MKKIRKHIAGIIILSLVMVMGTKTFTAETKKNGNPAYATVTYKVTNKSTKESAKFKGQFGLSTLFQTNFFRLFFRYCTGV